MTEPPPQPLPYRKPDPVREPPDPQSTWGRFITGLSIGTGVSAVLWIGGAAATGHAVAVVIFGLAAVVVPGTKLVVGISMLKQPPWKSFGAGLLASLALGSLILFGVCFGAMTAQGSGGLR
jgi:hypothetical protein